MLMVVAATAAAQDADDGPFGPDTAVLVTGPTPGEELPFLGPNVVSYWRGTYEYQDGTFVVYFTRDEVFGLGDWTPGVCGTREGLYRSDSDTDEPGIWHLSGGPGWHLFLDVRDFDGDACDIMPLFLERLEFFHDALGEDSRDAPLPAVVGEPL